MATIKALIELIKILPSIVGLLKKAHEELDILLVNLKVDREKRKLLESASKIESGKPIETRAQGAKEIEDQFNNLSKL